jgi:hypothetical protein
MAARSVTEICGGTMVASCRHLASLQGVPDFTIRSYNDVESYRQGLELFDRDRLANPSTRIASAFLDKADQHQVGLPPPLRERHSVRAQQQADLRPPPLRRRSKKSRRSN